MSDKQGVQIEAALALAQWSASAIALLAADLRNRGIISDALVEHLENELLKAEADASIEVCDALDQVEYLLRGDYLTPVSQFDATRLLD